MRPHGDVATLPEVTGTHCPPITPQSGRSDGDDPGGRDSCAHEAPAPRIHAPVLVLGGLAGTGLGPLAPRRMSDFDTSSTEEGPAPRVGDIGISSSVTVASPTVHGSSDGLQWLTSLHTPLHRAVSMLPSSSSLANALTPVGEAGLAPSQGRRVADRTAITVSAGRDPDEVQTRGATTSVSDGSCTPSSSSNEQTVRRYLTLRPVCRFAQGGIGIGQWYPGSPEGHLSPSATRSCL